MGRSWRGFVLFGVEFPDEFDFPWDKQDQEFDEWWYIKYHNIDRDNFKNYSDYYDARQRIECPFDVINICSDGCNVPAFVLGAKTIRANGGDAVDFNPADLVVTPEEVASLKKIIEEIVEWYVQDEDYDPEYNALDLPEPHWFVACYTD